MNSFNKTKEPGKPTVFLVQENPYINVLGAAEYGDIVVLFESGQQIMFSPQPAIRKLKRKLKDLSGDGKITRKDVLIGRGVIKKKSGGMAKGSREGSVIDTPVSFAKGGKLDIKKAIKKPGALRKSLGVKKGEKIPASKLNKAAKAKGKLGQRARFAKTLSGLRKK